MPVFFFSPTVCLQDTIQNMSLTVRISSVALCPSRLGIFIIYKMYYWAHICVGPPTFSVAQWDETAANGGKSSVASSNNGVACLQSIKSAYPFHHCQAKDFTARPADNILYEQTFRLVFGMWGYNRNRLKLCYSCTVTVPLSWNTILLLFLHTSDFSQELR